MTEEGWIAIGVAALTSVIGLIGSGLVVAYGIGRAKERLDGAVNGFQPAMDKLQTDLVHKFDAAQAAHGREIGGLRDDLQGHRRESAVSMKAIEADMKEGFRTADSARIRLGEWFKSGIDQLGTKVDQQGTRIGGVEVAVSRMQGAQEAKDK